MDITIHSTFLGIRHCSFRDPAGNLLRIQERC